MPCKKSQSNKEKSKTQKVSSHDKVIHIDEQDKSIFELIAAGGKVNPNLKKNSPPPNLIQVKSGSHAHGHIMRTGDYRFSPGLQQIRLEYKEAQKAEKSQSQTKPEKAANHPKEVNLAEEIRKAAKTNKSQRKSSSAKNTKLASEGESTSSKETSRKQMANSKTVDEKPKSKEGKKSDKQRKSHGKNNHS